MRILMIVTNDDVAVPCTKDGLRDAIERPQDDPPLVERLGRNGLAAKREYICGAEQKKLTALYEALPGRA